MNFDLDSICRAQTRIEAYSRQTPILSSSLLNQWLGHEIYFKAENVQKTGSFKVRGAVNTLAWLREYGQLPTKVVANSSGNHAQAVAYAASAFGIPATIYMPYYSSKVKIQATKSYGAEVVLSKTRDISDQMVKDAAKVKDTYWIPPFDHEQVIYGQGTAAYEALKKLPGVDAVFTPCGGGGLTSGSLIAVKGTDPSIKMFGVEPLNANDVAKSLRSGHIQRLTEIPDTLADGAMTMATGNLNFKFLQQLDGFFEVEEQYLKYWTQWLNHLLKCRVEPTSAMTMEGVRQWLRTQQGRKKVLVILSGGNVDQQMTLKLWKTNFLDQEPGL